MLMLIENKYNKFTLNEGLNKKLKPCTIISSRDNVAGFIKKRGKPILFPCWKNSPVQEIPKDD